ncbi:MAG: AtpZ/AtpI family protein [Chloroflexota bacterium]
MAAVAIEPENDTGTDRRQTAPAPNWGLGLDLGIRLGVSVAVGLGGGLLVDNWLHTSPIATLIGMVLGIGAAMVTIWRVASGAMRR